MLIQHLTSTPETRSRDPDLRLPIVAIIRQSQPTHNNRRLPSSAIALQCYTYQLENACSSHVFCAYSVMTTIAYAEVCPEETMSFQRTMAGRGLAVFAAMSAYKTVPLAGNFPNSYRFGYDECGQPVIS
jgi:hypothetical protein